MPAPQSGLQLRSRTTKRNRTSTWANITCLPTRCTPRTLTRAALSRTSTSSPARPTRRSTIRRAFGAATARAAISSRRSRKQREYGPPIPICWDNKTIGDEMDKAGLSWAYYATLWYGDGGIWSAYQNIKHIYFGPDWHKDVISPQTDFFSDVKHGKLRALTWITPTWENSDHAGGSEQDGAVVGRLSRQFDRQVEVLELDGDLYLLGRLRRMVRSEAAAARRLRRAWATPSDADRLAICEAREGRSHSIRARKHPEVRRGYVRPRRAWPPAISGPPRPWCVRLSQPPRKFTEVPSEHGIYWFEHVQPPDHHIPDAQY